MVKRALKYVKWFSLVMVFAIIVSTCFVATAYGASSSDLSSKFSYVYAPANTDGYWIIESYITNGNAEKVGSVTFDYYTDSEKEEYVVGGKNLISGAVGKSINYGEFNDITMYRIENDGLEDVYLLSHKEIFIGKEITYLFRSYSNCKRVILNNFNTAATTSFWSLFENNEAVEEIVFGDNVDTKSADILHHAFYNCKNLRTIKFGKNFTLSNATNLYEMFFGCENLQSLDLSAWSVRKATNMTRFLGNCKALKELKLGAGFTAELVQDFHSFFDGCENLTSLDLTSLDTRSATRLDFMFLNCKKLKEVKFGKNFTCENAENFNCMFQYCAELEEIDLSMMTAEKATEMRQMFESLDMVKTINLASLKTSNLKNTKQMFFSCSALKNIFVGNGWDLSGVTDSSDMFSRSTLLPNFNPSSTDKTNAFAGEREGVKGYLTYYEK